MPANFFENQERARKHTFWLVLLFALAVAGIGVAIYLVVAFGLGQAGRRDAGQVLGVPWDPELFYWVMVATVGFIGLASLFRVLSLREGGGAVARMLGGRLVSRDTGDLAERRLLNIVDEMSIASGIPVPEVYVLDQEPGINAFAAGYSVENAVVAVTRGALETLNRDELQGVIGHEFSHILNGDMRLNLHLIGVLFGILAIAVVGRFILYSVRTSSARRNKGVPAVVVLGLSLMLIGYIGVFVGRLIQAAVSRQREFLADASAVQFTRNPAGIGGALLKIAGLERGSAVEAPRASEAAHLFFGEGVRSMFGLLATHPPIEERVRRIDPALLAGVRTEEGGRAAASVEGGAAGPAGTPASLAGAAGLTGGASRVVRAEPGEVAARVGTLDPTVVAFASDLIAALSVPVSQALQTPEGAARLVCALLLDADGEVRNLQLQALGQRGEDAREVEGLAGEMGDKGPTFALALIELAAPALGAWPRERREEFLGTVEALIQADRRVTLFEFGMRWLLTRRLRKGAGPVRPVYRCIERVAWEAGHVVAAVARAGNPGDDAAAQAAFRLGLEHLGAGRAEEMSREFWVGNLGGLDEVGKALDHLVLASLGVRRRVVEAVAHCALADRKVTMEEAEVLRLVSIALGLPLPPWVETGA